MELYRYYLVNNDVNYYLATSFFRGTKLKALGSVCYNIKPNTQLRVLIGRYSIGLGKTDIHFMKMVKLT